LLKFSEGAKGSKRKQKEAKGSKRKQKEAEERKKKGKEKRKLSFNILFTSGMPFMPVHAHFLIITKMRLRRNMIAKFCTATLF
jgi:hypothetical protein